MEKIFDINYLTSAPESQHFDRKSARIKPKDILKHLIAFANAEGGHLVIGIEDSGEVTGFKHPNSKKVEEYQNIPFQLKQTPIFFSDEIINVTNSNGEKDIVLVISVNPSVDQVIISDSDEVFLRQADRSVPLSHEQRLQLSYDKGQRYFEDEIIDGATFEDIDLELINSYKDRIALPNITTEQVLKSRGLLKNGELTAAAILLFGKNPSAFLPQARLRVLKYDDSVAGVGQSFNVIKEKTFDKAIPRIITESRDFVKDQLRDFQFLSSSGEFEIMPEYPEFAWFEGIVNALTHRNYSIRGQHITVSIFNDHLEIKSPGILPNIVTIENILNERFSRNPKIARILAEFGWVKEMNEGVKRIYTEMALNFLNNPKYSEPNGTSVLLMLENNILNRQVRLTDKIISQISSEKFSSLNEYEKQVLHLAHNSGKITTSEIAKTIGKSKKYTSTMLRRLADNNLLIWHGASATDPTQYYTFNYKS
ncbi:ATP-binding protein [Streptococcus parauberis]|uniref:ATP-binding protein n=1 Tax=Streptococcus parauberis TaxID=1348 RepID=UPI000C14E711|nr:ATP-binding protein [Streptococcus parauberis]PIA83707.1 Divergent AAA domain protein [Streptococcus parauberis]